MNSVFYYDNIESPIGLIEVTATEEVVVSVYFVDQPRGVNANTVTNKVTGQLAEYFAGQATE